MFGLTKNCTSNQPQGIAKSAFCQKLGNLLFSDNKTRLFCVNNWKWCEKKNIYIYIHKCFQIHVRATSTYKHKNSLKRICLPHRDQSLNPSKVGKKKRHTNCISRVSIGLILLARNLRGEPLSILGWGWKWLSAKIKAQITVMKKTRFRVVIFNQWWYHTSPSLEETTNNNKEPTKKQQWRPWPWPWQSQRQRQRNLDSGDIWFHFDFRKNDAYHMRVRAVHIYCIIQKNYELWQIYIIFIYVIMSWAHKSWRHNLCCLIVQGSPTCSNQGGEHDFWNGHGIQKKGGKKKHVKALKMFLNHIWLLNIVENKCCFLDHFWILNILESIFFPKSCLNILENMIFEIDAKKRRDVKMYISSTTSRPSLKSSTRCFLSVRKAVVHPKPCCFIWEKPMSGQLIVQFGGCI